MSVAFSERELYRSCKILFGFDVTLSRDFLEYLQLSGIKTAYRQKARETHPDMVAAKGELAQRRNTVLFTMVQEAYDNLCTFLNARENGCCIHTDITSRQHHQQRPPHRAYRKTNARQQKTHAHTSGGFNRANRSDSSSSSFGSNRFHTKAHTTSHTRTKRKGPAHTFRHQAAHINTTGGIYTGAIPNRKLLFGHYLYYAGIIDFRTIIHALIWQKVNRPRVGELAQRFGWLSNKEVLTILRHRTISRPFGKSAVDMGVLSEAQLKTILFRQKCLQRKFGEYLVENNIITPYKLNKLIQSHRLHNAKVAVASRYGN